MNLKQEGRDGLDDDVSTREYKISAILLNVP